MKTFTIVAALVLTASSARAGATHEGFSSTANPYGWTWGNAADSIQPSGGNPGGYLANNNLDTYAPQLRCALGAPAFTGDYRAMGVVALGVDVRVLSTQFPFARELSLVLTDDNGTPFDFGDDAAVYYMSGQQVPQVAEGWRSFRVEVPSGHAHMPAGWQVLSGSGSADAVWNRVVTHVREPRWFFGDPTNFFIFDLWSVGADNLIIETPQVGHVCTASEATPCPCANPGAGLQGCRNSTGSGAGLDFAGTTSVTANNLVISAYNLPPSAPSLLFQGAAPIGPFPFGDGLRCVGGAVIRLGIHNANATGDASWGPGLAGPGGWSPFTTRFFQCWYRNVLGPCGSGFNLSSARWVVFDP